VEFFVLSQNVTKDAARLSGLLPYSFEKFLNLLLISCCIADLLYRQISLASMLVQLLVEVCCLQECDVQPVRAGGQAYWLTVNEYIFVLLEGGASEYACHTLFELTAFRRIDSEVFAPSEDVQEVVNFSFMHKAPFAFKREIVLASLLYPARRYAIVCVTKRAYRKLLSSGMLLDRVYVSATQHGR